MVSKKAPLAPISGKSTNFSYISEQESQKVNQVLQSKVSKTLRNLNHFVKFLA